MNFVIKYDGKLTKQTIMDIADNIVGGVTDGEQSALYMLEQIRAAEKILEAARERIEDLAFEEAAKFGKGESLPSTFGAKIQYKDGSARYDFSNSPTIMDLEQKLRDAKDRAKKGIPLDGEVLEKPMVSYTKPCIQVTF
jgi:hypothetical protein